jgi:hypothetical protein
MKGYMKPRNSHSSRGNKPGGSSMIVTEDVDRYHTRNKDVAFGHAEYNKNYSNMSNLNLSNNRNNLEIPAVFNRLYAHNPGSCTCDACK